MDWLKLKQGFQKFFDILPIVLGVAMGIVLIAQGAHNLLNMQSTDTYPAIICLACTIMFVGGLLSIVFSAKKDLIRCIGFYALSLGLSRILIRYHGMADASTMSLALGWIFIIVSANLCYTGAWFTLGNVIRRTSMLLTSTLLTVVNLIIVIFGHALESALEIQILTNDPSYYMINFIMYLVLILLLDSEQIRYGTSQGKHVRHMDRIRSSYVLDKDSIVNRDVARCLLERDGPLWEHVGDGFVESEMTFKISGRTTDSCILAQIWGDTGRLYLTIMSQDGSIINANRLPIDVITEKNGRLHFYGTTGAYFSLAIEKEVLA